MNELKKAIETNDKELLVGFIMGIQKTESENYKQVFEKLMEEDITEIYQKSINFAKSIKSLYKNKML